MAQEQLIQDYLANRLSAEESAKVERMLKTDTSFKSEFGTFKDVQKAFEISEVNKLKQHFKNLEVKSSKKVSSLIKYKYVYIAIASIVVIGFFFNNFNSISGDDLFNSNFEIYPNTYKPIKRSTEANDNEAPFVAYENNDFVTAEKGFEMLLLTSENPNIRFYYALSLLNQSKLDLALSQFNILDGSVHDYIGESLWFSALIHVKKENYNKAKKILNQLNTLNYAYKSEERKLLLQKLNDK